MNDESKLLRRRALIALLGSGLALPAALRAAAQAAAQTGPGGMHQLRGDVRVNGQRATQGLRVAAGDSVRTGANAMAVFSIGQDAFLVRANSRVEFSGQNLAVDGLRLLTGKLLGVFAPGGSHRLITSTATIGIRGTAAYLEAEPRRTYFCLCYGSAEVAAARSTARDTYSTEHHESPRYIYGDGRRRPIVMAEVANHTDDEVIMLEALVGRTPPPEFMASPYRY
jgi:hypothetical protein